MGFKGFFQAILGLAILLNGCASTSGARREVYQVQVESGDTLNTIATQFGTKWQDIVSLNRGTLKHGLRVGQVLQVIPGPEALAALKQQNQDNVATEQIDDEDDVKFTPRRKGLLFGQGKEKSEIDFIFPVEGRITSYYGPRGRKMHKGIDISANVGTPILAAADGEVIFSGRRKGYGGTVVVDHGGFLSLYAHCSKMIARVGDSVKQGDYIARSGRTGNARGAHLHFEIRDADSKPIDPLPFLRHKAVSQVKNKTKTPAAAPKVTKAAVAAKKKRGLLYATGR